MAGFRDFGFHYRKRSTLLSGADTDHVAIFADINADTWFIDELGNVTSIRINDLFASGNADISGNAEIYQDLIVRGIVSITGDAFLQSDLLVKQDATVSGDVYFGSTLTVDEQTLLNNTLEVMGDITGNSSLFIIDDARFFANVLIDSNTQIGGTTEITGSARLFNTLEVDGVATFNNNAIFNQNVTVEGNHTILGDLVVDGNVGIVGGLSVDSLGTISGNVIFSDNFEVYGNSYFQGDVETDGELDVFGDAVFQSQVQIDSNLTVTGDTSVEDLISNGNVSILGTLDVNNNVNFNLNLNVEGDLRVKESAEIDYDIVVHRDVEIDRNLFVEGILVIDSFALIDNDLHVGQDVYAHDDLYVEDFAQVSGGLHIINYDKNTMFGLHRNENVGSASEPKDFYHSIFWVEGATVCLSGGNFKTYLCAIENGDFGGFMKFTNPSDIDVVTISQSCSGDSLFEMFDKNGETAIILNGDLNSDYAVEVTGSAIFTGDIQTGNAILASENIVLSSDNWVELELTDSRGTVIIMAVGQEDDTPTATFLAASSSVSNGGVVSRLVSASASEGDQLEMRWLPNSKLEIRKDAATPDNDGDYIISINKLGGF